MNLPHILIVDDEASVRFVLGRALRQEGYLLDEAADGAEALRKLAANQYDLLLLDLRMDPIDGLQVLKEARRQDEEMAVIILTAHGSLESAVAALRLGAFDYLFKPAMPDEIRQRVRAGLQERRQKENYRRITQQLNGLRQMLANLDDDLLPDESAAAGHRFIHAGPLILDLHHRAASLNGRLLELTTSEFDLLTCLTQAAPHPVSPRRLLGCALGYEAEEREARETIKWHIHHLRRKIEPDPKKPRYIKTVRYKGYLWSAA